MTDTFTFIALTVVSVVLALILWDLISSVLAKGLNLPL